MSLVLLRCCARPPFSSGRLGQLDDHTVAYNLPRHTPDGRTCLFMDPIELLRRLAALIPPPRTHLVRYFGVLAPNAALREQVIQTAGPSPALLDRLKTAAACMGIHDQAAEDDTPEPPDEPESLQPNEKPRRASYLWAMLIARIYEALPLLCPRCGSPMKIIAFITDPASLSRILTIANQVLQKPRHPPGSTHKTPVPPPRTRTPATGFRVYRLRADLAVTSSLAGCSGASLPGESRMRDSPGEHRWCAQISAETTGIDDRWP